MAARDGLGRPEDFQGLTAHDSEGNKIGSVEQVFVDDVNGAPEWVTVKTGFFGSKESFVPLDGARRDGQALHVAHTKDSVKDAPRVDADQHLDVEEENELYRHYGITQTSSAGAPAAGGRAQPSAGRDNPGAPREGSGRGEEIVRSEERLRVGSQEREVGKARLRKYVVTENVTTTVPVSHEEVRVVREPVSGDARGRADIGEAEAEVTLHAEEPVIRKETTPVERVRLETDKVTEEREVSDTVRKEQIAYEAGSDESGHHRRGERRDGGKNDPRR